MKSLNEIQKIHHAVFVVTRQVSEANGAETMAPPGNGSGQ